MDRTVRDPRLARIEAVADAELALDPPRSIDAAERRGDLLGVRAGPGTRTEREPEMPGSVRLDDITLTDDAGSAAKLGLDAAAAREQVLQARLERQGEKGHSQSGVHSRRPGAEVHLYGSRVEGPSGPLAGEAQHACSEAERERQRERAPYARAYRRQLRFSRVLPRLGRFTAFPTSRFQIGGGARIMDPLEPDRQALSTGTARHARIGYDRIRASSS